MLLPALSSKVVSTLSLSNYYKMWSRQELPSFPFAMNFTELYARLASGC